MKKSSSATRQNRWGSWLVTQEYFEPVLVGRNKLHAPSHDERREALRLIREITICLSWRSAERAIRRLRREGKTRDAWFRALLGYETLARAFSFQVQHAQWVYEALLAEAQQKARDAGEGKNEAPFLHMVDLYGYWLLNESSDARALAEEWWMRARWGNAEAKENVRKLCKALSTMLPGPEVQIPTDEVLARRRENNLLYKQDERKLQKQDVFEKEFRDAYPEWEQCAKRDPKKATAVLTSFIHKQQMKDGKKGKAWEKAIEDFIKDIKLKIPQKNNEIRSVSRRSP